MISHHHSNDQKGSYALALGLTRQDLLRVLQYLPEFSPELSFELLIAPISGSALNVEAALPVLAPQ